MDLAQARTLLPSRLSPHVEAHRPDRDRAALHSLACWALRFTPQVAADAPDSLWLDTTGTERLHRGEPGLLRMIAAAVGRLGLRARVAAASNFGCAWGVAHYGKHDLACVPAGRERDALQDLPLAALRIDASLAEGLGEIGIVRVGDLLRIPRASLTARFDAVLTRRLQQALGERFEDIDPVRPLLPPRCELLFDGPTDRWDSVEAATRQVLDDLACELARREQGVRCLDLEFLRPRAEATRLRITLSRPSRLVKHLWSLTRSRLERVDLGGGIEGVVLIASRTARLRHEQTTSRALGSEDTRGAAAGWGELLDRLVDRLGAAHVVCMEPVESHLPEEAFRERSALEALSTRCRAAVSEADRPTILFSQPEPAAAMALTPDGPVLSLDWRGRRWRVVGCSAPERVGPEWWRWGCPGDARQRMAAPPPDRDYFELQTEEGRWLWACRQPATGKWFVHGEWA